VLYFSVFFAIILFCFVLFVTPGDFFADALINECNASVSKIDYNFKQKFVQLMG